VTYGKTAQLFIDIIRKTEDCQGDKLHVASFVRPDLSEVLQDLNDGFPPRASAGAIMFLREFLEELSEAQATVVLGTTELLPTIRGLCSTDVGGRKRVTAISPLLVPAVRLLVAGPGMKDLQSRLIEHDCSEVTLAEVDDPLAGIKQVLRAHREARLSVGDTKAIWNLEAEMNLLKAWFRRKPRNDIFAQATGLGLMVAARANVVLDGLLEAFQDIGTNETYEEVHLEQPGA
jgi:hypothetical protein